MAHLDAAERRVEVATLRAVGAVGFTVWWALVARSVAVGLAGGVTGALAGGAFAAVQDPAQAPQLVASWSVMVLVVGAAGILGAAAAGPTAAVMARRDPVPWLQES
jgi:ABC-type antimicrobial peptide transport system permease subunit